MDFKNVHHLREVMILDAQGKRSSMMQYSSQSISQFRPNFVDIPFKDQSAARELYARLGGNRREGMRIGTDVIVALEELNQ